MCENNLILCSVCGTYKDASQFRTNNKQRTQRRFKKAEYSRMCVDCKRKKDRIYAEKKRRIKGIPIAVHTPKSCRIYIRTCPETGKLFTCRNPLTMYSKEGYRTNMLRRSKERSLRVYGSSRIRICIICHNEYDLFDGYTKTCSDQCRVKHYRLINREQKRRVGRTYKSRARYHNVYYESFDKTKIFDRDNWHCRICGCSTPKSLMGSNKDNSPELDHIIPMSKGGSHTLSNVQLLCRKCNNIKSDKLIGQQVLQLIEY